MAEYTEWISVSINDSSITAEVMKAEAEKLRNDEVYARKWFEFHLKPVDKETASTSKTFPSSEHGQSLGAETSENTTARNSCASTSKTLPSSEHGQSVGAETSENTSYFWTRSAILCLIDKYSMHKEKFSSPLWRKKKIWQLISNEMTNQGFIVSSIQVENKWKHLTSAYKKAKDNNKESGAARRLCSFYNELDNILGKDANIEPPTIASSLSGITYRDENQADEEPGTHVSEAVVTEPQRKIPKKEPSWVIELKKNMERMEAATEQRHEEKMAILKQLVDVEQKKTNMLQELVNYLKK